MLIEVSKDIYRRHFSSDPNPYISEDFISLVENKTDKVVRLMDSNDASMGLIGGLKDNYLCAPFSAPFGGLHYTHEHLSYEVVYDFIAGLKEFLREHGIHKITITLPPDLYQSNMNAKCINAFIRLGFKLLTPEIINWIDLKKFDGNWVKYTVAQNCRKAIKNNLSFHVVTDKQSINEVYMIIFRNREVQGRKIHMTLNDIVKVNTVMPVDFFLIKDHNDESMGAGVFYRGHEKIAQGVFVGDDLDNRSLGIMDLLYSSIYDYYKKMDYDFIDLGSSGLNGEPNIGLLRFKEIHNCAASLKYTFSWSTQDELNATNSENYATKT
jgi:hypothetical protein